MNRFVAIGAMIFSAAVSADQLRYRAVDLTGVAGASATPVAINDQALVAISGQDGNGNPLSVLYDAAQGQVVFTFAAGDRVRALSDDGNACGDSVSGANWLVSDGVRSVVPLAQSLGVNDSGQVAGFNGGFFPSAALFSNGTVTQLGTLGGRQSTAAGINARGQVTGTAELAGAQVFHAFRWSDGAMEDLGSLAGPAGNSSG